MLKTSRPVDVRLYGRLREKTQACNLSLGARTRDRMVTVTSHESTRRASIP